MKIDSCVQKDDQVADTVRQAMKTQQPRLTPLTLNSQDILPPTELYLPPCLPPLTTRCSCRPPPHPSQVPQLSSPPVVSTSCQILLHLESIPNPSCLGVVTSFSVSFKHRLYLHHIHTKVLPQLHLSFWGLLGSEVYPRHCPKSYFEIKY